MSYSENVGGNHKMELELTSDREQQLTLLAQKQGITVEELVTKILLEHFAALDASRNESKNSRLGDQCTN
jgi:hypothetical protein